MHRNRGPVILLFVIVAGVLIGSLIGTLLADTIPLLRYGPGPLGIENFQLDLKILTFQFGLMVNLNVAGLIGLLLAGFLWKRMM